MLCSFRFLAIPWDSSTLVTKLAKLAPTSTNLKNDAVPAADARPPGRNVLALISPNLAYRSAATAAPYPQHRCTEGPTRTL